MTPEKNVPAVDQGLLTTIEKLQEVPLRTIEALLEGLSAKPADFAIMGLGFVCGYEGIDLMQMMMKPFKDMAGSIIGIAKNPADILKLVGGPIVPQIDLSAVAMNASGIVDLIKITSVPLGGVFGNVADKSGIFSLFPNKHITPATKNPSMLAPGVSYYGPPPSGFTGPWPPYGTTLANLEDQKLTASDEDKWKYELEQWWLEARIKIVMGCAGAILAYMVTRPGFVTEMVKGVGEITKGIGEIVPL